MMKPGWWLMVDQGGKVHYRSRELAKVKRHKLPRGAKWEGLLTIVKSGEYQPPICQAYFQLEVEPGEGHCCGPFDSYVHCERDKGHGLIHRTTLPDGEVLEWKWGKKPVASK